ncbi:MAG TPA: prenyltransferase, partial [Nannocystis exedens]|nr:prenyltransferase [Nannocystis exedens]
MTTPGEIDTVAPSHGGSMWMSLIRLGRLKFLQYSPILYNLGAVVALLEGAEFRLLPWALGLGFVWLVHAGTHYCNEYYDLPADRLNRNPSPWTGGSRVLVNGDLDPKVSIQTSSVAFALAVALAFCLPSGYCQALAALIILLSWGYSVPPIRLAWRGFGEATVIAVLNLGVPLLGCALLLGELPLLLWLTLLPLVPISFTRMLIMNMADAESDRAAGKRTLVVKLGMAMSSRVHRLGLATAYLLLPVAVGLGLPIDAAICLFIGSGPLALWISHRVAHWPNW